MIPYEDLAQTNKKFNEAFKLKLNEFLEKGWYVLGSEVELFENRFSDYCRTDYSVGVASGLDALILAIESLKLPKRSEIIVPSNTYIASILAIIRAGYIPVLVEPNIETYNIDPTLIEGAITAKTVAIMVVHLYGKACEMDTICSIAESYKLSIIEDCAQAHGAKYKDQLVGSFGIGCFSFYPTKNLGALGDAGGITLSDYEQAQHIRALRNYGSSQKYYNDELGYNSRLDELQAVFLNIKLDYLKDITEHKRYLAYLYNKFLHDSIIKPTIHDDYYDVFHIYNIRIPNRDSLREYLEVNGVKTEIHYPVPPHHQKGYQNLWKNNFPISEEIHNTTLSLPIAYFHTEKDIIRICELINRWIT